MFQSWSGCLCKNIGQNYLWKVYERAGIPQTVTKETGTRLVKEANKRKCRVSSKIYKVRRLELNSKRKLVNNALEVREGDTYESGITLSEDLDTLSIPAPVAAPRVEKCPISEYCFISFDVDLLLWLTIMKCTAVSREYRFLLQLLCLAKKSDLGSFIKCDGLKSCFRKIVTGRKSDAGSHIA